ncbi:hypothetical protein RHMOL_Rhmol04G0092900 [Rhododendron molle]|uniref:Uncharacterized protein n=1 Tax=Rhododendron molle TaxID=49168 RepID=A0ACC0P0Z2_RHOML|nr:hypothetical protein RHMOL_Rhmol04G0092900 [Rhododendron molle]
MSSETFSVMMLLRALANQELGSLSVILFRESLTVICNRRLDKGDCCMWVLKEYGVPDSWTELLSFKLDRPVCLQRTLGFRKHGEVLLLTAPNRLLSYDIGSKELVDTGFRGPPYTSHYEPFVESLVSVECKNGVLDGQLNQW